jgi:hypothetical protein
MRADHPGPAVPAEDEDLREGLDALVDALALVDDDRRRANLMAVWPRLLPAVRRLVIDGLIRELRSRRGSAWRPAQATLVELGAAALPAVYLACYDGKTTAFRVRLAEVMEGMAAGLSLSELRQLFYDLDILAVPCPDKEVTLALVRAQAAVRRASERIGGAGAGNPSGCQSAPGRRESW